MPPKTTFAGTGRVSSTAMPGVCMGVGSPPRPRDQSDDVLVTAQRCDAQEGAALRWQFDASLGHFVMDGKCLDAGGGE